jgi:UDP-glucose 4-epimerase
MSKNLVITGVSGFIGRHVAEEAIRRGYRVAGVDRKRSDAREIAIDFTRADVRDRDSMMRVVKDNDYVIHLAAVTSNVEFVRNPVDCYDINVTGFANVIDAAAKSGCRKLIYASSAAVYLDTFSEDAIIEWSKQSNHYAKTKMMNEMMAKSYQDIYGMTTTGLRYFNVYGEGENEKGDYASIITLFLRAKKEGAALVVYGDGTQARDLINVMDAARITLDLLEKGSHDVYNVGTGVATAYGAIAEMIDEHIRHVPNPLASYQHYTRAEIGRLRGTLRDYKCRELKEGVREMCA